MWFFLFYAFRIFWCLDVPVPNYRYTSDVKSKIRLLVVDTFDFISEFSLLVVDTSDVKSKVLFWVMFSLLYIFLIISFSFILFCCNITIWCILFAKEIFLSPFKLSVIKIHYNWFILWPHMLNFIRLRIQKNDKKDQASKQLNLQESNQL